MLTLAKPSQQVLENQQGPHFFEKKGAESSDYQIK